MLLVFLLFLLLASYDVNKDGVKVAVLTFPKSAYRLGETVTGVVEINERTSRARVIKVNSPAFCILLRIALLIQVSPSSRQSLNPTKLFHQPSLRPQVPVIYEEHTQSSILRSL